MNAADLGVLPRLADGLQNNVVFYRETLLHLASRVRKGSLGATK